MMSQLPITPVVPQPGQESVWDYPRPPRLEPTSRHITVVFHGVQIAETRRAWRVLETSHPPVYYIPREDIAMEYLHAATGSSFCEWKGSAAYFDIQVADRRTPRAAWTYAAPTPDFRAIAGCVAFYPGLMDACYVDGEQVEPQPGGFYGGWITKEIVGPFKGGPGSWGW
jgi:uncharacterized protein (DUF427 family)